MGLPAWQIDDKFGLIFIKTIGFNYLFEVRDKGKFLMAKIIYNI